MIIEILLPSIILLCIGLGIRDYKNSPYCNWCNSRHYGRCIFNPRAGKIFSNTNDGYFDYNNPNL